MSALKLAIEKAVERRHIAPTVPAQAGQEAAQPPVEQKPGAKRAVLALEELRRQPHSAQLNALRSHFESCITQPSRYVDQQQLSRWTRGSRCTDREYSAAASGMAQQTGLRWSKDLESDIGSVVTEAGLSGAASAAVVDAAKKGSIADNPGVLLCQIMALQSALDPHLGRRAVTSLIRVMPSLLNTSSDTLAWHYEELAAMFGPEPAASLAVKAPFVLGVSPFMIWSKLTNMQSLMGASVEQAKALALRQPRLLAVAQTALESRLKELQSLARLDGKQLRRLVANQPALLTYAPATLASNMAAMARCLGTTDEQTAKLLSRSPTLLMLSPSTVSAKITAITALLDCTPAQATAVVTSQPTVLSISSELLAQKLTQVGAALHTSPKETAQVLRSNPSLLTLSSTTLARKLGKLHEAVDAAAEAEQACGLAHTVQLPQQQHVQRHRLHRAVRAEPSAGSARSERAHASAPHAVLYPPGFTPAASMPNPSTSSAPNATSSKSANASTSGFGSSRSTSSGSSSRSSRSSRRGSASAPTPSAAPSHPQSLASAWLQQLQAHSPQQRASLACFSEKRYARLPALAAARAAALMGQQRAPVGTVQRESIAMHGERGCVQQLSTDAQGEQHSTCGGGGVQQAEDTVMQGERGPVQWQSTAIQGEQHSTCGGGGVQQAEGTARQGEQHSMGGGGTQQAEGRQWEVLHQQQQQQQQQHAITEANEHTEQQQQRAVVTVVDEQTEEQQRQQQAESRSSASGSAPASAVQHGSVGVGHDAPGSEDSFQALCVESFGAPFDSQQGAPSGLPSSGEAACDRHAEGTGCTSRLGAVAQERGSEAGKSRVRVPSLASLLRMTDAKFKAVMEGV